MYSILYAISRITKNIDYRPTLVLVLLLCAPVNVTCTGCMHVHHVNVFISIVSYLIFPLYFRIWKGSEITFSPDN